MRHKFSQNQKQQQKMALTPQMRQSIALLAMPVKELSEYVDTVLEKNPFLKKEIDKRKLAGENYHTSSSAAFTEPRKENQLAAGNDPRRSLLSQLAMRGLNDRQNRIAEYLVYEMDDNGYISVDLDEAARDMGEDAEAVDGVLDKIQEMDPPGIGARGAQECLELQLKRSGKEGTLEYRIVKDHLTDLAAGNIKKIASVLNASEDDMLKALQSIKKLNPRPASTLLSKIADPVIPDLVAHIKKGRVSIGLNRDWFPKLKFYNPYENKPDIIKDEEAREFVKTNERGARNLIDSLKRREDTMCKVANHILSWQISGISKGRGSIKSLTIRDVAYALKLHPSTISRTVSNKHVQLENRVFPLKTLLCNGMKKVDGRMISRQAVMDRLAAIIKSEDNLKPLSDDKIKLALRKEGIVIERRTVAKYRACLRILPGRMRKKQ